MKFHYYLGVHVAISSPSKKTLGKHFIICYSSAVKQVKMLMSLFRSFSHHTLCGFKPGILAI